MLLYNVLINLRRENFNATIAIGFLKILNVFTNIILSTIDYRFRDTEHICTEKFCTTGRQDRFM